MNKRPPPGQDRLYDILFIESDPDQIAPFIEAFENTAYTDNVHVVSTAAESIDFICQRGNYADAPKPDLILLDLHISEKSGLDVLNRLNEDAELRRVPVIAVTESAKEEDIARSYELSANAYVNKPSAPEEFDVLAEAIEGFWLRLAQLPPK